MRKQRLIASRAAGLCQTTTQETVECFTVSKQPRPDVCSSMPTRWSDPGSVGAVRELCVGAEQAVFSLVYDDGHGDGNGVCVGVGLGRGIVW